MTRYSALYDAISKLEQNSQEPILIPKGDIEFHFDKMYPGCIDS